MGSPTSAAGIVTGVPSAAGDRSPGEPAEPAGGALALAEPGLSDRALLVVTAMVTLPILWMGYGTDLDVGAVRAVGDLIRHGDYTPSRNPGVPVFEAIVAVLDPLGHIAVNLASAAAAGAAVVGIARLVRTWGRPNGDLVALAFLASPITLVAATSTTDFIWAIAFFVWAALAHLRDRSLVAGLLFALAIGSRSSTFLLIGAFLVADAWAPEHRGRCLRTAAVTVPAAVALYVPAWLAFDRTFGFLETADGWRGVVNNMGRFAYKNYAVAGVAMLVVAAVAAPALVRALRGWGSDPLVRFAVLGFGVTEALYFRLPWKPGHLLPALMTFVLWVAASDRNRRPFLMVLVAAVALNGLVGLRLLTPDNPDESTSAELHPAVSAGLLVNDIDCRADFMGQKPTINSGSWACALKPMRGSSANDPTPPGGDDLDNP